MRIIELRQEVQLLGEVELLIVPSARHAWITTGFAAKRLAAFVTGILLDFGHFAMQKNWGDRDKTRRM